ncbi:hypothetical protein V7S76_10290 [Aquirufa sp. ROCK2-A2]
MEKVYFQNNNANLPIELNLNNANLVSILPQFEDSVFLPSGTIEMTISTRILGIKLVKEKHIIDIKEGVNNVSIQLDEILDKVYGHQIGAIWCGILLLQSTINSKKIAFNFTNLSYYFKDLLFLIGFFSLVFFTSSYLYLSFRDYHRYKKLAHIFVVSNSRLAVPSANEELNF